MALANAILSQQSSQTAFPDYTRPQRDRRQNPEALAEFLARSASAPPAEAAMPQEATNLNLPVYTGGFGAGMGGGVGMPGASGGASGGLMGGVEQGMGLAKTGSNLASAGQKLYRSLFGGEAGPTAAQQTELSLAGDLFGAGAGSTLAGSTGLLGASGAEAALAGSGGLTGAGGAAMTAGDLAGMTGSELGSALSSGAITSGAGDTAGSTLSGGLGGTLGLLNLGQNIYSLVEHGPGPSTPMTVANLGSALAGAGSAVSGGAGLGGALGGAMAGLSAAAPLGLVGLAAAIGMSLSAADRKQKAEQRQGVARETLGAGQEATARTLREAIAGAQAQAESQASGYIPWYEEQQDPTLRDPASYLSDLLPRDALQAWAFATGQTPDPYHAFPGNPLNPLGYTQAAWSPKGYKDINRFITPWAWNPILDQHEGK